MAESATVRVIINALTESAEQSIDEVGDEITGLSDDAAIGQTALDQLSDEFGEATTQSMILQSALDELEDDVGDVARTGLYAQTAMDQFNDELGETTTQSSIASGALTALAASASGANLSFRQWSVTTQLSLIPAILTLLTVLAPLSALLVALTAGAAALAGAFGAIVGSGVLAFGQKKAKQNKEELAQTERLIAQYESLKEQTGSLNKQEQARLDQLRKKKKRLEEATTAGGALKNAVSDLKDELVPIISQFGEQFIPLIEDALNAIPTLVRRMIDAVGGTEQFRDALREFGAAMMEVLPALTGFMFDLARNALPLAREFFGFLMSEGPGAMDAIFQSVTELEPEFRNLLDALIDMAPVLLEFGTTAAKVVLPALTALIRAATGFMETVNDMPGTLQGITVAGLVLAPVLVKLASALSSILMFLTGSGILANLSSLITHFTSASTVTGALANATTWLSGALSTLAGSTAAVVAGAVALGAAIGGVVVRLLQITGIMGAVGDAGAALGDMLGSELTSHLLTLISVLTLGLFPLIAGVGAAIGELVKGDLQGAADAFMEVMGVFADAFGNTWGAVVSGLESLGAAFLKFFTNDIPAFVMSGLSFLSAQLVTFFTETVPNAAIRGLTWLLALVESKLNAVYNTFVSVFNAISSIASSAVEGLINSVVTALNEFLSTLDDVADSVSEIPGVDAPDVGTLDTVSLDNNAVQAETRSTDTAAIQQRRQEQSQQVIQGGVNVSVDASGDVQNNPYQWSRRAAEQLQRETRQQYGSNR
jgi:hypothetical protein